MPGDFGVKGASAVRPNLFIVGAMKSGTSSLHRYLGEHPEVFMCEPKEPSYFVKREQLKWPAIEKYGFWRGEEIYLRLFAAAGNATVIGESSTLYTKAPGISGVPDRIAAFNPNARIIYLMRDPVERTLSHYWHMVREHVEWRPLLRAIREKAEYMNVSHYAMQLSPYLNLFGEGQVRALTFEEMVADTSATMRGLFTWLGVDPEFVPPSVGLRENPTPERLERVRGRGWLNSFRYSRIWNAVGPRVPQRLRNVGRTAAVVTVNRKDNATDRQEVIEYLRPIQSEQTRELSRLLGRCFPEWETLYRDEHSLGREWISQS